ncbi:DUF3492 domain-containing protein [Streptomyces sp. DSM 42041]|uniref:D-inositol 3-phosphate glycosyltransferase n=1 Tax=Streptomyces hazeniae TaxID=3075538 RepID=A0ABU2NMP2_9ACTN|nr:DUF3492 domain-containing protein [Streptomyces sp. DSM 42041]MDT0378025.1 DUF3492 domain-containing protein [Streptomyces sp. DSM 42041]
MRVALLTEGGYPFARGESVLWCDRLVRGLGGHEFELYALSRSLRQEQAGWCDLPQNVRHVRTAPLWGEPPAHAPCAEGAAARGVTGRRERRRFAECFAELAAAICTPAADGDEPDRADRTGPTAAERFAAGLHGLADLARDHGGLPDAIRSELAVRVLESACRAPGALRAAHAAQVSDLLAVVDRLERALRPLSLDWLDEGPGSAGLGDVDLCHAVGGGPAALAGLLAARAYGTPLLITEYGVRLREHYLASTPLPAQAGGVGPGGAAPGVRPDAARQPVRALLASFQGRLAHEAYARAQLITPGNTHARRWQERCGARRERLRTVYPGMDAEPFTEVGEAVMDVPAGGSDGDTPGRGGRSGPTLLWVGRVEPAKDLVALLHAFSEVRHALPGARLRIVSTGLGTAPDAAAYAAHLRALAAHLFPDEAADTHSVGESPVAFEEIGGPAAPTLADAYAGGTVAVLSSVVEGFPVSLVEAMFCARATVSTDVGAVCEVIGGTGLVVPPRNPRALADACLALLRDPARRTRLGAAARARALELFTVEQNVEAFRGIYLELMSRSTRAPAALDTDGAPVPFAQPAESHVPGRWASTARPPAALASATASPRPAGVRSPAHARSAQTATVHGPSWARHAASGTPAVGVRPGQEDPA